MERAKLNDMVKNVPTISNRLDFRHSSTYMGSKYRLRFWTLCVIPIYMAVDFNGGMHTLGFGNAGLRTTFKFKPDFMTGKIFVAQRQDLTRIV
mmetsp:Transcript_8618/g.14570  ORF Transcript_8618/g.14570 Transcript_8618/m.14570 type:complete len:93 (+) Transcript_8618:27-305(+)